MRTAMTSVFNGFHCLILLVMFPCSSSRSLLRNQKENGFNLFSLGRGTDSNVAPRVEELNQRRQEEDHPLKQLLQQQEELLAQMQQQEPERIMQDAEYCQLCQGLSLLADKIPFPESPPCSDVDLYYQFMWPEPTNLTVNTVGTCRSDVGYNFYTDLCCIASIPRYECEQNVHDLLFSNPYNTAVPPIKSINEPLDVIVSFTYQALEHLEVELGTATIILDISMRWNDPRLAWNVIDGDTCTNAIDVFTGQEVEKTQIWLPDFDLLNQINGFQALPDSKATIFSDGTVEWQIGGGVEAFCAFTGLANIPFDLLGCQMLFGPRSRTYSKLVNYILAVPDFAAVGAFELAYSEWTIDPVKTEQGTAFDGGVIYYNLFFTRATRHYIQNIVTPTIILTYLSFFTYLLDMRVGERLGFGMALALVIVAQQIVTADLSPVSDQFLWLDKFVGWSFYWVVIGIVQSVIIGYMYFVQEDEKKNSEAEENSEKAEETVPLTGRADPAEEENAIKEEENLEQVSPKRSSRFDFIYTVNLHKVDLLSLVLAVVTYSLYIAIMYGTLHSGAWLKNEPRWFYESDTTYPLTYYNASDPNN